MDAQRKAQHPDLLGRVSHIYNEKTVLYDAKLLLKFSEKVRRDFQNIREMSGSINISIMLESTIPILFVHSELS